MNVIKIIKLKLVSYNNNLFNFFDYITYSINKYTINIQKILIINTFYFFFINFFFFLNKTHFFIRKKKKKNMIANITTIMYILTVSDENTNNGILQKGTAISRIDDEDGYQTYKFYCYLAIDRK